MLTFKKPALEDQSWAEPLLYAAGFGSCEYAFSNIYKWWGAYGIEYTQAEGFFVSRSIDGDSAIYNFPAGPAVDDLTALRRVFDLLREDCRALGKKFVINGAGERQASLLRALFGDDIQLQNNRDYFDYVYSAPKLAALPGKKMHSKRNHIAFFEKTYNWSYEPITRQNIPDCLAMNEEWCRQNGCSTSESLQIEHCAVKKAFADYEQLGLRGGLLRVDGQVVAFTFGHAISKDYFDTHVEKAFGDYRGAYPMINREFAKTLQDEFLFINREEDLGEEGLRKAKLSYKPELLLEKYTVTLED